MNPNQETLRKIDRLLNRLDRDAQRPRSKSPLGALYLTLALIVGYQLLVRFVPLVWSSLLPHGLAQAEAMGGLPGLVFRLGVVCRAHFNQVLVVAGGVSVAGFVLSRGPWPARLLVWLAALGVVLADGGIVFVAVMTCLSQVM